MIKTKEELKEFLEYEKSAYVKGGFWETCKLCIGKNPVYLIWHYQKLLRLTEYYYNSGKKIRYFWYKRMKNKAGAVLGIQIEHNVFDKGLIIYHYGSIIVHSNVKVGKNCKLHGENCIGNNGKGADSDVPVIGDNCDVGVGAKILGKITLGNNVTIGANAVIIKSFQEENIVLAGLPGMIKKRL